MHNALIAVLALAAGGALAQPIQYPATAKKSVTDTFHGTQVAEEYRWLEDGKDPAVRQWSLKQLEVTRAYLDALPQRPILKERLAGLLNTSPIRYFDFRHTRNGFFALKRQPPKNQPMLVVMNFAGDMGSERVLLDPNTVEGKASTAIDFYEASQDGRYVAVSLSLNGSEDGSAHVIEVASGKRLKDVVPRVAYPTGGGDFAWDAKSTGFYYTRYPQGKERAKEDVNFYQQVWFHKLGAAPSADKYVIGREFPRIAETQFATTLDGRHLLASVANGDGGEYAFYLRNPAGKWTKVADFADNVRSMALGYDGRLYALVKGATPRGRVLAMPLENPKLAQAKEVVAQVEDVIQSIAPTATRLYVTYLAGGPSEIRMFDLKTGAVTKLPSDPVSSNFVGARLDKDDILTGTSSYLQPLAWYRFSPGGELRRTALAAPSKVSFADCEVVREMAPSRDGTKVPVNIIMKKGTKLDGSNPVLLTAYGGYGISLQPSFSESRRVWLDGGGILAVANLRGGGEFGEAWHLAGNLTKKQNVFDDMIGVAEHLVARGYTKPERLAAIGGSNGGLLMGAILVQRRELFRAIVSSVGIYDMLRVELTPNGAFNVTEFGTVKDPAQFKALYAYSPYHHVKDGTAYPALLLTSGENDGRVDPYNSRKMAARLQAANPSGRPVLLRISMDTGHGMGTPLKTRVEEEADTYSFLMGQLGMVLP